MHGRSSSCARAVSVIRTRVTVPTPSLCVDVTDANIWLRRMRGLILAGVSVMAMAVIQPGHAQTPQSAFDQGFADRASWEHWTTTLSGDAHDGAIYWSGQRSLPNPGSCAGPVPDWTRGCNEAQKQLALSDVRRKAEPDYKAGWNAWTPGSSPVAQPVATYSTPPVPAAPSPSQPLLTAAEAYKAIFGEAQERKAAEADRQAQAQRHEAAERERVAAEAERRNAEVRAEAAARLEQDRLDAARRAEAARQEDARREAAAKQEAETRAAAQLAAENSPDNYCRKPTVAGDLMSSFTKLLRTQDEADEAIDIEHLTTVRYQDAGVWSCHGVFVLSSGRRLTGILSSRLNIAGKSLVNFHAD